ncbi:enoyl-CoA hydratase/isomerase family protein [Sinorhizobium mexicanum]|uniref:Enoyl-CoA hydratase/isomerase family protein n=1 Tax=Sinorhizobium mexicanum TaxID=375549 RepID=A0A859QSI9_9HYPH|nr:enoyl-CoA hydratase/isomerase family protein [Sinorhizobium mexicanum]MBP1881786.1 enoyl-CoA hydratase/carnithine racemase [Sinorhizobium mexicanum]QLL61541.1 enoyl-CoA hydratase/isomerase family protein [Sinorhizobium mexicanum]
METTSFADGAILVESGRVAKVLINRQDKRNAINAAMWSALLDACDFISKSDGTRVVVLSGAGKHFCAGADITEFADTYRSQASADRYNGRYRDVEDALRRIPCPVIAEVRGACFGGGLGLALSADFRFSDSTAMISITASKLGIAYGAEDSARLIEKIGPVRAKDLLFSARTVGVDEAMAWGLVDQVFPPGELASGVRAYAETLASRSPASLKAIKSIVNSLIEPSSSLCERLRPTYSELFAGSDLREGARAFLEKREPLFK